MVESFISTQKNSVQRKMTQQFRRYLMHKQDLNDLVMHALQVSACMISSVSMPPMKSPWHSSASGHTLYENPAHLPVLLLVLHAEVFKAT